MLVRKKDIEHMAELARLHLTADEISHLSVELGQILKYVDKLKEVADHATPTHSQNSNSPRSDEVITFLPAASLISTAPHSKKGLLAVPPVFED